MKRPLGVILLLALVGPSGLQAACISDGCAMTPGSVMPASPETEPPHSSAASSAVPESAVPESAVPESAVPESAAHCDAHPERAASARTHPAPDPVSWDDCCGPDLEDQGTVAATLQDRFAPGLDGLEPTLELTAATRDIRVAATLEAPLVERPPLFRLHAALLI